MGLEAVLVDLAVCQANGREQAIFTLRQRRVEVEGPGDLFPRRALEEVQDGLGCETAGDVTRTMAAHAIGHDEQIVVGEDCKRVLVMLPLQAHVGDPHPARSKLRPWYRLLRHSAQNHKSLGAPTGASAPHV